MRGVISSSFDSSGLPAFFFPNRLHFRATPCLRIASVSSLSSALRIASPLFPPSPDVCCSVSRTRATRGRWFCANTTLPTRNVTSMQPHTFLQCIGGACNVMRRQAMPRNADTTKPLTLKPNGDVTQLSATLCMDAHLPLPSSLHIHTVHDLVRYMLASKNTVCMACVSVETCCVSTFEQFGKT